MPDGPDPYMIRDVFPPMLSDDWQDYSELEEEWLTGNLEDRRAACSKTREARNRVRQYLSMNGAKTWARVDRALSTAIEDRESHPAATIVSAVTAAELTIRFLLLRPLIAGFVFHTKLAKRLVREGYTRRTELDRRLLPEVCGAWGIDLDGKRLPNGEPLWNTLESLIVVRNLYVHRAEPVAPEQAHGALDCATGLVEQIFKPLVEQVELPRPPVGWADRGPTHDPAEASIDYMGS